MHTINFWQCLISLTILLLSGCAQESRVTDNSISKQEAIDIALNIASTSQPEISGSQVTPSNVHAEQMTLGEAIKRIRENSDVATGYTPDMPVWLVTMDGIWLNEMKLPRPTDLPATDLPTPEPGRHFIIIIDAKTGLEIEGAYFP